MGDATASRWATRRVRIRGIGVGVGFALGHRFIVDHKR